MVFFFKFKKIYIYFLGCLIELPELEELRIRTQNSILIKSEPSTLIQKNSTNNENNNFTFSDFLPPSHKEKPLIDFKHNLFYEEKEEVQEALKKLKPIKGSRVCFIKILR